MLNTQAASETPYSDSSAFTGHRETGPDFPASCPQFPRHNGSGHVKCVPCHLLNVDSRIFSIFATVW
jgi:hypothetical protein